MKPSVQVSDSISSAVFLIAREALNVEQLQYFESSYKDVLLQIQRFKTFQKDKITVKQVTDAVTIV